MRNQRAVLASAAAVAEVLPTYSRDTVIARGFSAPALESAGKRRRIGITQFMGDHGHFRLGILQQSVHDVRAMSTDQITQGSSFLGKATLGADTKPIDPLPFLKQWPQSTPG